MSILESEAVGKAQIRSVEQAAEAHHEKRVAFYRAMTLWSRNPQHHAYRQAVLDRFREYEAEVLRGSAQQDATRQQSGHRAGG